MNAATTTNKTPHSIANPSPKWVQKSDQGLPAGSPKTHEPKLAPKIASGTPIKINQ